MKILVIENDWQIDEDSFFADWVEDQKEAGNEVRIICRISQPQSHEVFLEGLAWAEMLAFTTVFDWSTGYEALADFIGKFLKKSGKHLTIAMHVVNYEAPLERMVEKMGQEFINDYDYDRDQDMSYYTFNKEKAQKWAHQFVNAELYVIEGNTHTGWEMKKLTFLDELIQAEQKRIDFESNYKATARDRKTGRRVRILDVTAHGSEFAVLVKGSIMDELDMSQLPNKVEYRSDTWVWGRTEPVRLIQARGINEFEIVK